MEYQVSVRRLVEFIFRHGDLDNRKSAVPEEAMQEGARIHRKLQREYEATLDYESEVALKYCFETDRYNLYLDGRADGILNSPEEAYPYLIDEIKGTYKSLDRIEEPEIEHLAQAKCYAYIFSNDNLLEGIRVRITYCNIDTDELKHFIYTYSFDEISEWFFGLMNEYKKWTDYEYDWENIRTPSINQMEFPFEYRQGQKTLVSCVYRTIQAEKKLFVQAPTGSGKTISAVYPTVKAIGEGRADKLFYLTAKTITRTVAEDTFSLLRSKGLSFKTVTLTAKEKICVMDECDCNPKACMRAKGHLDRINAALYDILIHENDFTRDKIEEYAEKHQVCPFELALDISLFSDGVICDYNYAFDPHVYLRRFFAEGNTGRYIFLVDEAHNLLDRSREMYSADLILEEVKQLRSLVVNVDAKLATALGSLSRQMQKLKKKCESYLLLDDYSDVSKALGRLVTKLEAFLERDRNEYTDSVRKDVLDFYFKASHFQYIEGLRDERYRIYCEKDENFRIKQLCIDPSFNLENVMLRAKSCILFSATLLPIQYYKGLLGGGSDDFEIYANSVFDTRKRALCIGRDVTSKYTRRGENEYHKMAAYISRTVRQKQGNYMVFFPSFAVLEQVKSIYEMDYINPMTEELIVQKEKMSEEDRESFLIRFSEGRNNLIGFCVLGGIFAEGIDLSGQQLIGAIIIGNGMPGISIERNIMRDYFDENGYSGFDYAYKIPGLNKVEQAAGRVIRTSEDTGVIILLEERFLENHYQQMFPKEWKDRLIVNENNVSQVLSEFWRHI